MMQLVGKKHSAQLSFSFRFLSLLVLAGLGGVKANTQPLFVEVATAKNIVHDYGIAVPSGGVSFCDFNGDGWDDLTLATIGGSTIDFYQNRGGTFEKISALVPDETFQGQVLWVDYDNDGDKDLFMASRGEVNRLYRNDGNLSFTDVTTVAGLTTERFLTYGASFGDFDRDGWLDLYIGKRTGVPADNTHLLYQNQADGTFREVAVSRGAQDPAKIPFCYAFFDYNNDMWPDLYTANDRFTGNTLLRNNQDGTFTDISESSATGIAMNAMSVTIGDYNNDGQFDIYATNTTGGNVLLRNNGDASFSEVAGPAGVGFYSVGWGALFLDSDNKGREDLYVSGMEVGADINSSAFYYNMGDESFTALSASFVGDTVQSFSNALGDFNKDGKIDLMVINSSPFRSQLWENQTISSHGYISIELEGVLSNRDAIGSRIDVYSDGQRQSRFTQCGTSFLGQNSERNIIGIGLAEMADSIVIHWPTGHVDRLEEVMAGAEIKLLEGSTTGGEIHISPDVQLISSTPSRQTISPLFSVYPNPASDQLYFKHDQFESLNIRSIRLFNVWGQLEKGYGENDRLVQSLDLSELQPGIYWLEVVTSEGQQWIEKLIKQ